MVNGGRIRLEQINSGRPSYVNAVLIQRAGDNMAPDICDPCRRRGLGKKVFPECRRLEGYWGDCCGNCKWSDHGIDCTWTGRDVGDNDDGGDGSEEGDDDDRVIFRRQRKPTSRKTARGGIKKTPEGSRRSNLEVVIRH